MLSKRKMAEAAMVWIQEQLEDARGSGISLRDDADGTAIRVNSVKRSGTLIRLDISCTDDGGTQDLEYCLLLQQKMPAESVGMHPSGAELQALDDTP